MLFVRCVLCVGCGDGAVVCVLVVRCYLYVGCCGLGVACVFVVVVLPVCWLLLCRCYLCMLVVVV